MSAYCRIIIKEVMVGLNLICEELGSFQNMGLQRRVCIYSAVSSKLALVRFHSFPSLVINNFSLSLK